MHRCLYLCSMLVRRRVFKQFASRDYRRTSLYQRKISASATFFAKETAWGWEDVQIPQDSRRTENQLSELKQSFGREDSTAVSAAGDASQTARNLGEDGGELGVPPSRTRSRTLVRSRREIKSSQSSLPSYSQQTLHKAPSTAASDPQHDENEHNSNYATPTPGIGHKPGPLKKKRRSKKSRLRQPASIKEPIAHIPTLDTSDIQYSAEQLEAIKLARKGKNLFITGPAGTGKSKVIERIVLDARQAKKTVRITAPTGIAAQLVKGTTLHSFAGVGLGKDSVLKYVEELLYRRDFLRKAKKLDELDFLTAELLIIDEVSMVTPKMLQIVDSLARAVRRSKKKAFGGIQVIFCGDFRQLPPVEEKNETCDKCGSHHPGLELTSKDAIMEHVPRAMQDPRLSIDPNGWRVCESFVPEKLITKKMRHARRTQCGNLYNPSIQFAFQSPVWHHANPKTIFLQTVYRQSDVEWIKALEEVAHGKLSEETLLKLHRLQRELPVMESGIKPTKLFSLRKDVDELNLRELRQLNGPEYMYKAVDYVEVLKKKEGSNVTRVNGPSQYYDDGDLEKQSEESDQSEDSQEEQRKRAILRANALADSISRNYEIVKSIKIPHDNPLGHEEMGLQKWQLSLLNNLQVRKEIPLRIGAQVMLLRNFPSLNLVNGSRGIVTGFREPDATLFNYLGYKDEEIPHDIIHKTRPHYCYDMSRNSGRLLEFQEDNFSLSSGGPDWKLFPVVEFVNKQELLILPEQWEDQYIHRNSEVTMVERTQIPLGLAWATTIHKSQGQTLDRAFADLEDCFTTGQAYVALSRCKSPEGLQIFTGSEDPDALNLICRADPRVIKFYEWLEEERNFKGRRRSKQ